MVGKRPNRLFTVLYFSARSPRSHANSETGVIFVYIASATWGRGRKSTEGMGTPDTRPLGELSLTSENNEIP